MKIDLAREFHSQIVKVNREPGCMDTLGSTFTDRESHVFKIGEEDKGLTILFNPDQRTAEINGKAPIKFYYFIQVKLAQDETKWCYSGGENKAELAPHQLQARCHCREGFILHCSESKHNNRRVDLD